MLTFRIAKAFTFDGAEIIAFLKTIDKIFVIHYIIKD